MLIKRATPSPYGESIAYLEVLAEKLRNGGWYARVVAARDTPCLRVINPRQRPLNDDITVSLNDAGLWFYHWSWGERICHVGNVDIAVARVTQVLGCEGC